MDRRKVAGIRKVKGRGERVKFVGASKKCRKGRERSQGSGREGKVRFLKIAKRR